MLNHFFNSNVQPQAIASNANVLQLTPNQYAGITYNAANGTFTVVTPGLYFIEVTLNTANPTTTGAVFSLIINNNTVTPAAPGASSATSGQISVIRVQNYAAGDTIQIRNTSTFTVNIVNGANQANSAGHVSIFRFAPGFLGTLITTT
ncbi:hypothetical protein [Geomicrobium sp. JCM 19055]|uniref:hypothetical protein n=1 Tax=Geomicrobium sp. JCM 19055 TaxID=1460649 RepID=UPI00045ED2FE|nr:hypothetical protein [Geomicrobium sp. JCM 19055]GAK00927.1 hypothetical protein JCM19055_4056 [Geomicrobium sp. JCM 19055]